MPSPAGPPLTDLLGDDLSPEAMAALARMPLQHLTTRGQLNRIVFEEGLATVTVSAPLVLKLRLKNAQRHDEVRLARLRRSIAQNGYGGGAPVICRIGQKGKWVVLDGGHRLTALRQLYLRHPWYVAARAAWRLADRIAVVAPLIRALFGEPDRVYVILFLGPRSNRLRAG